jgi:predicted transcriptional regulator
MRQMKPSFYLNYRTNNVSMKDTTLTIKMNSQIKQKWQKLAEEEGLNLTALITTAINEYSFKRSK